VSLLGRSILILALACAIYALVVALSSRSPRRRRNLAGAERGVYGFFALMSAAMGVMWFALTTDRFELRSVAEYTSSTLGFQFKLSALWASQSGSLLLWAWILSGFSALVVWQNRKKNRELMPIVIAVLMSIGIFFAILLSFVTSPFEALAVVPEEGRGLNPLLQNPYMVSHPPLLYLGYVGLAIPFAFAIAALVTGRLDASWIAAVRRWTVVAWLFLGVGILLGSRWAYEELGWGGYWAWDPVENAAFMPWLVATAFIHSIMVQERRGMLRVWNMVLVVLTFSLALFGTFLTRSGVIASVHAFGESTLGPWFLAFIAVVLTVSTALIVYRLPLLRSRHSLESYLSREGIFLFNNLLLVGLAFAVFWGTVFPILSEAARGTRITVGQGYYDQIAVPIGLALLVLTGVGPLIPWRKASARQLWAKFWWPVAIAVVVGVGLFAFTDAWDNALAAGVFMAATFVVASVASEFWRGMRVRHALGGISWPGALGSIIARNRRRYGGYIVHIGIAVLFVGLAGSSAFASQGDFALQRGEVAQVDDYQFRYDEASRGADEHAGTVSVKLAVFQDGDRIGTMDPAVRFFFADEQRSTEVAVDSGPTRDLYIVLAGLTEDGTARFSVFVNPLVSWIWTSGLLILIGGLIGIWPTGLTRRVTAVVRESASDEAAANP
jgi:cytochrome c-type biogenesis protein CcmF